MARIRNIQYLYRRFEICEVFYFNHDCVKLKYHCQQSQVGISGIKNARHTHLYIAPYYPLLGILLI